MVQYTAILIYNGREIVSRI